MEQRVFAWSGGRRVRVVVTDVRPDVEQLLHRVEEEALRIVDRERLADDVSAIFNEIVRLDRREIAGAEEVILTVG